MKKIYLKIVLFSIILLMCTSCKDRLKRINFGTQGENPISWYIISDEDDNLILMSEELIDTIKYHDKNEKINWEDTTLYEYLNTDFINIYFSKEEKERLLYISNISNDMVTMPTLDNLIDLYGNLYYINPNFYNNKDFYKPNKKIIAKASRGALDNDIEVYDNEIYEKIFLSPGKDERYDFANGYSSYWVLNSVEDSTEKYYVTATGYIANTEPNTEYIGIRPIIRIKKS